MAYEPPYTITNVAVNGISEVSRLLGEFTARENLSKNPRLRRVNRIRSIHSSLAIENNTLSIEEVTAVLYGRRVLAPPKDIHEAKNAYEAYEHLLEYDPYSIVDLLNAHRFMMDGLVKDAGRFRNGNVGVFAGDALIHAGSPAKYVSELMADLFAWLRTTDAHPLIASSVFHCEFEFIHPFSDGNGRTGRLWQTLILQRWNPLFAWLPVETLVAEHQQEYYDVLEFSQRNADAARFIEFMVDVIALTLEEQMCEPVNESVNEPVNKATNHLSERQEAILNHLRRQPTATYDELASVLGISRSTIRRELKKLVEESLLKRDGADKNGHWVVLGPGE